MLDRFAKRLLDLLVSTTLLLLLLPLFLVIIIIIKATSPGPIIYKSPRYGRNKKQFNFLKFRSMYVDAKERHAELMAQHNEKDGPIFKMKNDPRITPIGRWMRKYSIDELPQIVHVFMGDMTLVGPRPMACHEADLLTDHQALRMAVPQGLTCYWQIMGRSDLSFDEWIELDLKYVEDGTFLRDLEILVKTPAAVLTGKGAY